MTDEKEDSVLFTAWLLNNVNEQFTETILELIKTRGMHGENFQVTWTGSEYPFCKLIIKTRSDKDSEWKEIVL